MTEYFMTLSFLVYITEILLYNCGFIQIEEFPRKNAIVREIFFFLNTNICLLHDSISYIYYFL